MKTERLPKFLTLKSLKASTRRRCLPHDVHAFSPTHCLFYFAHGLHLRIACFTLVIVYTHALLILLWSWLTPTHFFYLSGITPMHSLFFSGSHFVDYIYDQIYLSTSSAGFIAGQGNILLFHEMIITCTQLYVSSISIQY